MSTNNCTDFCTIVYKIYKNDREMIRKLPINDFGVMWITLWKLGIIRKGLSKKPHK